jgi:signal peptidase I
VDAPSRRTPDHARPHGAGWGSHVRTVLLAVTLAFGVRVGIAQAYEVDGPSMEPTVFHAERVLVARCAYGLALPGLDEALVRWGLPRPGDVVIVRGPLDGLDLVKRVVGGPGDSIEIRQGVVIRNGVPLAQQDAGACDHERLLRPDASCRVYLESLGEPGAPGARAWRVSRSALALDDLPTVEVPPGHVFVMGDHRDRSNDSRYFGPVPASRLRGRVLFVQ